MGKKLFYFIFEFLKVSNANDEVHVDCKGRSSAGGRREVNHLGKYSIKLNSNLQIKIPERLRPTSDSRRPPTAQYYPSSSQYK